MITTNRDKNYFELYSLILMLDKLQVDLNEVFSKDQLSEVFKATQQHEQKLSYQETVNIVKQIVKDKIRDLNI